VIITATVIGIRWCTYCSKESGSAEQWNKVPPAQLIFCASARNEWCAKASPCSRREGRRRVKAAEEARCFPSFSRASSPAAADSLFIIFRPTYPIPLKLLQVTACANPAIVKGPTHQPKWRVPIPSDHPLTLGPLVGSSRSAATGLSPNPQATNIFI
jgi:hypothetical protein